MCALLLHYTLLRSCVRVAVGSGRRSVLVQQLLRTWEWDAVCAMRGKCGTRGCTALLRTCAAQ